MAGPLGLGLSPWSPLWHGGYVDTFSPPITCYQKVTLSIPTGIVKIDSMAQALQACKHGRFNWGASAIKAWGLWCDCRYINYIRVYIMCVIRTCDCMQSLFHFHTTICSMFRSWTCNRQTPHPPLVGVPFPLCTTRTKGPFKLLILLQFLLLSLFRYNGGGWINVYANVHKCWHFATTVLY